nr:MAG TPA: hypothetical protein [Caudoviricetes sp.]
MPVGGSALDFRLRRFGGIKNPLLCRSLTFHARCFVGKVGDFFASIIDKLSIFVSFYISIFISLSAHADFSVWALFFFVLRCTFVISPGGLNRYTGRKGRRAPCGTGST